MTDRSIGLISGVLVIALSASLALFGGQPRPAGSTTGSYSTSTVSAPPASPAASGTYTLAQVATHKNASSCWTTINGNVYDVTNWIAQHPGGEAAILSLCGIDGSFAFNDQHGGQRRPANELATFKIGTLAK